MSSLWYVFQRNGDTPAPLGPWPTEVVAEAILAGQLAPDIWVASPGGQRWVRALDVPVIAQIVEGQPTRQRFDSGMRPRPGETLENVPASSVGDHDARSTKPLNDTVEMTSLPAMSIRLPPESDEDLGSAAPLAPPSTPTPPTAKIKAAG